jgi:hypothetical protein
MPPRQRGCRLRVRRAPSGWSGTLTQTQELPASTGGIAGEVGYSLGFDGTTIAAGARGRQLGDYVFTQPPATTTTTTTTSGTGATAPPTNTGRPSVSGTAKAGGKLTCSKGDWTGSPTRFAYQWYRDGTPIQGATSSTYTVQKSDEQLTLTCAVTTSNAKGAARPADSKKVAVPVPKVKGCPAATGTLSGSGLGLLRLGMTRAQARHAYTKSSNRGKRGLLLLDPDRCPRRLRLTGAARGHSQEETRRLRGSRRMGLHRQRPLRRPRHPSGGDDRRRGQGPEDHRPVQDRAQRLVPRPQWRQHVGVQGPRGPDPGDRDRRQIADHSTKADKRFLRSFS